jgi:hypothetical protein
MPGLDPGIHLLFEKAFPSGRISAALRYELMRFFL